MITLKHYFKGREEQYKNLLTPELRRNADETVQRTNLLLNCAIDDRVFLEVSPVTGNLVTSGWRPPEVNASIPNAAPRSKHLTCQAIDIYDPEGLLDDWCMDNLRLLEQNKLWLEHPSATKGWCHLQSVPPKSGKRVFYP